MGGRMYDLNATQIPGQSSAHADSKDNIEKLNLSTLSPFSITNAISELTFSDYIFLINAVKA